MALHAVRAEGAGALARACAGRVFKQLTGDGKQARTVTLKLRYHDFRSITRRRTLDDFLASADEVFAVACELLSRTDAGRVSGRWRSSEARRC